MTFPFVVNEPEISTFELKLASFSTVNLLLIETSFLTNNLKISTFELKLESLSTFNLPLIKTSLFANKIPEISTIELKLESPPTFNVPNIPILVKYGSPAVFVISGLTCKVSPVI